jgi:hypothetical protein
MTMESAAHAHFATILAKTVQMEFLVTFAMHPITEFYPV